MNSPRIGSLFAGYGGLEMGVQSVLGGTTAWYSDVCKHDDDGTVGHYEPHRAPCAILAHHWPHVPNVGDITAVDWDSVEPIDVLTGGFPCQDVSHAGKRLGLKPGTRSGLWSHMAYAIDKLRPRLVVAENVRGLLSAEAGGDLEPCPWCVGDGERGALRALGAVLGDLADLGFDAQWVGVRASDAGAPHGRFRVFVFAWPAGDTAGHNQWHDGIAGSGGAGRARQSPGGAGRDAGFTALADADRLGHQRPRDTRGRRPRPENSGVDAPAHADGAGWEARGGRPGAGHARRREPLVGGSADSVAWGDYGPAIRRWERLTRPAPLPTEPGKSGTARLSPRFVEWMQGLPAGHVTAVPGLSRNDQLKALGNGVVPQQAALATRIWAATMQGTYLTAAATGTGSLLPTPTASLTHGPTDTVPDASWENQPRAARNLAAVSVDPTIHPDRFKRATGTDDGCLW